MAKKMLIDATHAEETRVVVVDGNKVEEFDFETVNKRQLAGNIYLAKVTRVEPSLQAAFVDYGGNRHGFLAFSEIHPDYYQIPVADRQALLAEERAYAEAADADESQRGGRRRSRPARSDDDDARKAGEANPGGEGAGAAGAEEGAGGGQDGDHDGGDHGADDPDHGQDAEAGVENGRGGNGAREAGEANGAEGGTGRGEPYVAADHASDTDDDIESVAEEDVAEEIRMPRKPRPRRYKIQEVVKVRQIMLVQVVKEERGNKGAALTTYLSLAGRYCVLMPNTARGGGISRKITNAADRKKLKEIAGEIEVPEGAGLIIRTAGSQRTKTEIKRDYEYLLRLWEQVRDLTLRSIAPAPIYEEGDLIKRTIRDLYSKDIDEVLVEGEKGYRAAKDFMRMIMPSHAKNVRLYTEQMPLFARFQVETYLGAMFNPTVQLKSGGYIVIGVTEALVAIDVNSGRATKEGSIEETALKTNLEASEEIARQLRLRDLAGLIVIDFIDMEERKNNAAVEKRLKEKLKTDRARIQVGRISGFGLLEMSRQRLRPGMLESTTAPCQHCHGTGLVRSDDSLALSILRQLEEEGTRKRSREVLLKAPVGIVNFLMNQKREHIAQIELRYGLSVRVEADPSLISPDFAIEKFKTATRSVPEAQAPIVSADAALMDEIDEEIDEEDVAEEGEADAGAAPQAAQGAAPVASDGGEPRKKKRRRRRRRKPGQGAFGEGRDGQAGDEAEEGNGMEALGIGEEAEIVSVPEADAAPAGDQAREGGRRRTRSRGRRPGDAGAPSASGEGQAAPERAPEPEAVAGAEPAGDLSAEAAEAPATEAPVTEAPKPKRASRSRKAEEPAAEAAEVPKKRAVRGRKPAPDLSVGADVAPAGAGVSPVAAKMAAVPASEPVLEAADAGLQPDPGSSGADEGAAEPDPNRPKKRGWWSLGR
ncbi:MAG: Rne/Rng family ribonuclease [Paracoccaceae bacterium]